MRIVHPLRSFALLAVLTLLTGCQTAKYSKLRVTNHRGEFISEWVARGKVTATDRGYLITAVERHSAPPLPVTTYYPDGWRTNVVGPHILRWRCPKPLWLAELDGDVPPGAALDEGKAVMDYR